MSNFQHPLRRAFLAASQTAISDPWTALKPPPPLISATTLSLLLQESADQKCIELGKIIHTHTIKYGLSSDVYLNNRFCTMYSKCRRIHESRLLFDKMPTRDRISWNSMVTGYAQLNLFNESISMFNCMRLSGVSPDEYTLGSILRFRELHFASQVHGYSFKIAHENNRIVCCNIVDIYAKAGRLDDARQVFNEMPTKDLPVTNAIISGYAHNGYGIEALEMFGGILWAGFKPDSFTFASMLGICTAIASFRCGVQFHGRAVKSGFDYDVTVCNSLISMYSKTGNFPSSCQVFDEMPLKNVVSWNAMISGCLCEEGRGEDALRLFSEMLRLRLIPNLYTVSGVLNICSHEGFLEVGKQLHAFVFKLNLGEEMFVNSILVDMYCKCLRLEEGRFLFERLPKQNVISWSMIITAYAQRGHGEEAVKLFLRMNRSGMNPNQFTLASLFGACGSVASLKGGRQLHVHVFKHCVASETIVINCIIDMYAKCGSIDDSRKVFDTFEKKDRISWTSMIGGYSQHGLATEAIRVFGKMQEAGIKPDYVTFVGLLSACGHSGLVEEGLNYFKCMSEVYGIIPRQEHYNCIVDLLSRAGLINDAFQFIKEMPFKAGVLAWGSLLRACRLHGNMEVGNVAARHLLELEPDKSGSYVELSNMFAAQGRWEDKARIRKLMKDNAVKKEIGYSWIEIDNKMHIFCKEDTTHPQTEKIYAKIEELTLLLKEAGYVPDTSLELRCS